MIATATSLSLPFAGGTFHAALCSPPYWGGLRVYSGPQVRPWPAISYNPMPGLPPVEIAAQAVPLGHEADPFAFVGHLLQVFREVRRTLRPDGVLCVNLGDCYAGSRCGPQGATGERSDRWFTRERGTDVVADGLRPKNLLLMPWRFALAMQADGWVLRSRMPGGVEMEPDVLWKKNSTMPSSAKDRPTVDFEDVLIFAQRGSYYWDQEAGREEAGRARDPKTTRGDGSEVYGFPPSGNQMSDHLGTSSAGRNMRAAWTINPEPTDENHYASWPVELAARLIRVTTSERGCCPECGAPWERVVERDRCLDGVPTKGLPPMKNTDTRAPDSRQGVGHWRISTRITENGWRPTCNHPVEPVPCRVLDPFAGLGRTWEAARETGRRFAGVDLSLEYCRIARSRSVLAAAERRKAAEAKRVRTIRGPLFEG